MLLAPIAALMSLAEPTGALPTGDEPKVIGEQAVAPIAPVVEPAAPPLPAARQPPATTVTALPPPTAVAPTPPPPSVETADDATPARGPSPSAESPSAGFGLELGYAHGGDRFLTVVSPTFMATGTGNTANAGDGLFFSLVGSWTPYTSETGVGVGVYARAGAKFVGVGDSATTVSFLRCPLAAGAQLLLPITERWFVVGRLGVLTEVLEELTVTSGGVSNSSRDFSPRLGEFVDAGLYWRASRRGHLAAIARYERLDISYRGVVTNANNLGGLGAAYFSF